MAAQIDDPALSIMSRAIQSLDTILQELREVEKISQSRTPAGDVDANSPNPSHLLARSLTAKLETLTAGIRDDILVRTLLPTLPAAPHAGTTSTHSPDTTLALCIPNTDHPKRAKTSAMQMIGCRHFCKHHKEVVDPWLWSTLPLELVEIVFAKLPLQTIITLTRRYGAWAELTNATNFREFCAQRHPKLLALMRWGGASADGDTVRATVFDVAVSNWVSFDIAGFPPSRRCNPATVDYGDSRVAHDGGLVCFVPPSDLAVVPVLVTNPLTKNIRRLALIPQEHRRCYLVQIVVDAATKEYRVMVVCGRARLAHEVTIAISPSPEDTSHCYDSATEVWSVMESGFVYGCGRSLKPLHRGEAPAVFDCKTKVRRCSPALENELFH